MFYPEASNTVIFIIMAIVLLIKPAGLFGRERCMATTAAPTASAPTGAHGIRLRASRSS